MTPSSHYPTLQLFLDKSNWILGELLLAIDCIFASAWLIVQASILKRFPAELIVVFFYCFFVAIQSAILCLAVERTSSAWRLKSNIRLIAVLYSQTGLVFCCYVQALGYCIFCCSGDHLLWGHLPCKFCWSHCTCQWFLLGDVGKNERRQCGCGEWSKQLGIRQSKCPSLAKCY